MDRWDERNKGKGWDYDDVQVEFEDFFDEKDISDYTAEDWNLLELEFERVISMLNRAEKSGKKPTEYYNTDEEGWWPTDEQGRRKGKKANKRKYA